MTVKEFLKVWKPRKDQALYIGIGGGQNEFNYFDDVAVLAYGDFIIDTIEYITTKQGESIEIQLKFTTTTTIQRKSPANI